MRTYDSFDLNIENDPQQPAEVRRSEKQKHGMEDYRFLKVKA
jgi:hypothetical protein